MDKKPIFVMAVAIAFVVILFCPQVARAQENHIGLLVSLLGGVDASEKKGGVVELEFEHNMLHELFYIGAEAVFFIPKEEQPIIPAIFVGFNIFRKKQHSLSGEKPALFEGTGLGLISKYETHITPGGYVRLQINYLNGEVFNLFMRSMIISYYEEKFEFPITAGVRASF